MPSKWAFITLNLLIAGVFASVKNDNVRAFIKLTEFDYEDSCWNTAEAKWNFVNSPSNNTLLAWENNAISYATFKNSQRSDIANISKDDISNKSLQYKYEVAEKVGDALLNPEDYYKLVHFAGTTELLRSSRIHKGILDNHTATDVERILSRNNNIEKKNTVWRVWHENLATLTDNYSTVLSLTDKAAKANGAKNVVEYWELLTAYADGYEQLKYDWNRIGNLHKKLLKFVTSNLLQKYNLTVNDTMPAYLFGSLQGNDWNAIALEASLYPELTYSIQKNLWKRKLIGKSLYTTASAMSSQMLGKVPQADFWDSSRFNGQCPAKLINFCRDGLLRVSTCFEPTISNYLLAHKNVGKIVFNQISIEDTPVLNTANRYSALEEGVSELFGILAASPAWLNNTHVIDNSTDSEQHLLVSLMITALDTLPRIAYYMSADMWRINAIETGLKSPKELASSWWKHRKEYEGLDSNGTDLPTFMNDEYITSNKPYLPKIAGTLLAFQLYEYLMKSTEVRYNSIMRGQLNVHFFKMIQQGSADDWTKVIDKFLEIDQVSTDALLSFFSPLEDFIDDLDEDFRYKSVDTKELEELEKKIIVEINTPSTTTTTTSTTTTPTSIIRKTKMSNATLTNKQNDGRSVVNSVAPSNKDLESKSSLHTSEVKAENRNLLKSTTGDEVPFDESLNDDLDTGEDKKPKINTSKAVWAVGAVLLAVIIICVIAIFGRRRCQKTPKNRRYV